MVASFEAKAGKLLRKPYFELLPDQQREWPALAQRVVRVLLQDLGVSFRRDATSVVSLVGGSMDNAGEVMVAAADVDGYVVDVLRRARTTQLSMRQTLRLPRRCNRDELYEARRAIRSYDAVALSVRGHGGNKRAAAVACLADLVGEQVHLAQEQGLFTPPGGTNKVLVLVCTDAKPLWRPAATRCDVVVGVWLGGPASAGNPDNWVPWWFMDGIDDRGRLCAMDGEAGLNAQAEHLQSNSNVRLEDGTVLGYEVGMTGDRRGMQVTNYSPDGKCWSCDDHDSPEPVERVNEQMRWRAFLRAIPPPWRVGDYAHATAPLCNATQKKLQQYVSSWVQEGDGRGVIGRLKDVWGNLMQASQNIPQADRVALRPTKKNAFDLTSARVFLDDAQYQQRVVDLLKEYYPNRGAPNGAIKVYTVVHSMLLAPTHLHTWWRKKDYLSDVEVEEAERWAKRLWQCWKLMGWEATVSVHRTVCHSGWFVRKYRTMYFFSLVPTDRSNSAYKVRIQNRLRGWSLKKPRVSVRGMRHLLNMYGLDVGLKRVGSPSTGIGRGQNRKRNE